MPMGERAFAESKGSRKKVAVRVTQETHLALKLAGRRRETTPTGQATDLLEQFGHTFFEQLRADVSDEKARRG